MKLKTSDWMRWMLTLGMIVGVQAETGWFTAVFAGTMAVACELQCYANRQVTKALRLLRKLNELPPRPDHNPHWRS